MQYARYYGVFQMLGADKMEHWSRSRVEKNEIIKCQKN